MFSNDSRWDRHTPDQARLEDVIEVGAVFQRGRLVPKFFYWKKERYNVEEVTYVWQEKRGEKTLHFFTVRCNVNIYQIYLNDKTMTWRLKHACPIE